MKTSQIYRVQTRAGVVEFVNETAAEKYALKHGGRVLAANEPRGLFDQSAAPTSNPFTLALLGLPATATASEYAVAWASNGRQSATLNVPAIREGLIRLAMGSQSFSRQRAEEYVQSRCPKLFPAALSRTISGQNEKSGMTPQGAREYLAAAAASVGSVGKLAANEQQPVRLAVSPTFRSL